MKEATKTPQDPLAGNPSRLLCQGLQIEKKNQFSSSMARSGAKSVSRQLRPIINHHPVPCFCLCILCSVRLPHSLSQGNLASAKVYLVLGKWALKGTLSLTLWALFTTQKAVLVLTLLRLLEQPLKFVFSHGACESQCVSNKKEGQEERQTYCPPSLPHRWLSLGLLRARLYSILIPRCHAVPKRPSERAGWASLYSGSSFRVF